VETRAVLGKGEAGVSQAMEEMEEAFPFKILGIDSDNGSEFINYHLYRRCQKLKIQFTRGRPYKKDDNAHIEQKNWTHVRKLMGWDRYDRQEAIEAMNDLYKNELRLFMNLFMPSMKLLTKKRIGSRLKRVYDKPQTPFERLVASHKGDPRKVADLRRFQDSLDPFELAKSIEKKLEHIWSLARHQLSPKVTERPKAEPQQLKPISRVERETFKNLSQTFTGITFYVRDPKRPGKYKPV
jgi:transposase InsO family protein